jgi:hypothetical protein
MKTNNVTDDMLVKYLLNEVSEAEKKNVVDWISKSAENKNHFNDLKLIWNQSRNLDAHTVADTGEAWKRFERRTKTTQDPAKETSVSRSFNWVRMAAALLLLAGTGSVLFFMSGRNEQKAVANKAPNGTAVSQAPQTMGQDATTSQQNTRETAPDVKPDINDANKKAAESAVPARQKNIVVSLKKKNSDKDNKERPENDKVKEFVCNSTPCPIEICIIQSIKCHNSKAAIISTCSTIAPDESGQLRYKAFDKMDKNCKLTIQQITIKRISTGETIVLTANSKPSTAEDLFNYITGQKKGDITAGIFHSDCSNRINDGGITLDNRFGDLRLQ